MKLSLPYKLTFLVVPIFAWFFYNGILVTNSFRKNPDQYNYFKYLSISFLNGKTDINPPESTGYHDLIIYNNKKYLYWPPAPAIAYIPLVLIFGSDTPDEFILSLISAMNVLLVMLVTYNFCKINEIPIKQYVIPAIGILWGLGTVQFNLSMYANVWSISQVIAQTFLLTSLLFFLYYLLKPTYANLILSSLFWAIACYTRNDLVFSFFFFLVGFYISNSKNKESIKALFTKLFVFIIPFFIFSVANLLYNYSRFSSFFENGLKYHQMDQHFQENFNKYGYFSKHYILYNFLVEVISTPPIIDKFPYFGFNPEGTGMLCITPVFLLFVPLLFYYFLSLEKSSSISQFNKNDKLVMGALFFSICFISLTIFSIMGTGFWQFGARYTLDFQLFVILFILFIFKTLPASKVLNVTLLLLLLLSVYINYIGTKHYYLGIPF